jgi:2-polyprenyl-3-methyl-5-hydroxy-6-metoxy-1,4-benzoquinol methylase
MGRGHLMRKVVTEKCYICGSIVDFIIEETAVLLREAECNCCGASLRNSDVAKVIVEMIFNNDKSLQEVRQDFGSITILNTATYGAIHKVLDGLPGYVCGEYFDGIISGHCYRETMCVDLRCMPFPSNHFDLIISEDVIEHINGFDKAMQEINRVLKKEGCHVFSVPVHEGRNTQSRTGLAPVYHGIPLVITDFGDDLLQIVDGFGMRTKKIDCHRFYDSNEITNVDAEYQLYKKHQNDLLKFFKYNSSVFAAVKQEQFFTATSDMGLAATGERFIPGQFGPRSASEHLQRYTSILELVKDKVVLDAACGEGYGSNLLAEKAMKVTGIDISEESIYYAKRKYHRNNLMYIEASITQLPIENSSVDVVVSFETIEHVPEDMQRAFLREIKRVLKPDGILIISTPDKLYYSDIPNVKGDFHIKEFYEEEFNRFLKEYFRCVDFNYQGVKSYVAITNSEIDTCFSMVQVNGNCSDGHKYIIAVCSDVNQNNNILSLVPVAGEHMSTLYLDYGEGFMEMNTLNAPLKMDGSNFSIEFAIPSSTKILGLRWDPLEGDFCRIHVSNIDVGNVSVDIKSTNAKCTRDGYDEFLNTDPSYYLSGDFNQISHLRIEGMLCFYDLTTAEICLILENEKQAQITTLENEKQAQITALENEKQALKNEKQALDRMIEAIFQTKSWRFTAPLRYISRVLKK